MGHVGGQDGIVSYDEDRLRNSRRMRYSARSRSGGCCQLLQSSSRPVLLSPSAALAQDEIEAEFSFMFESGAEGWMVELADSRPRQGSTRSPVR